MINNKGQMTAIMVVVVIVILLGIGYYYYGHSSGYGKTGNVIFVIGDPSGNISGVTNVNVTISKVEAHSMTKGWVTIVSNPGTYDLIALKNSGQLQLVANSTITPGKYDQVRMNIDKVIVVD